MKILVPNTNITFVQGFTKGLLIDSYRNHIEFIPNSLVEFINNYEFRSVSNLSLTDYNKEVVNEYLEFLISNEYCFLFKSEKDAISFKTNHVIYDSPHVITNCIFQIGAYTPKDSIVNIISELVSMECWFIEFLIDCTYDKFLSIVTLLIEHKFNCAFIHYNAGISSNSSLFNLIESLKKLPLDTCKTKSLNLNIYGSELSSSRIQMANFKINIHQNIFPQNINCGAIKKEYFSIHIENLRESIHKNSCLNRKISIDYDGNIKNCPSMPESYGNIRNTTLAEAIEKPGFKKYWDINKDKIHVCKDCEFRYICTDCRAYVEDPEDIYSKPLKCGYNPYTGEWSEWSTNPLKQKAIDFYGMREMVDNMNKNADDQTSNN